MSSLPRSPSAGNWRGQTFNYDVMVSDPQTEELYALTFAQRRVLLAAAEILGWVTRWYSETDQTIDRVTIRDFCDDILYRLMTPVEAGGMFQLRQSELAPCILEQSLDGGETWLIAYDYSLCQQVTIGEYNVSQTMITLINNTRIQIYDGTPQSVNGDCPTVFDGDGGTFRTNALCSAVKHYVEGQVLETLNRFRIAAGLAALGAGALGLAGGPLGAVIGGAAVLLVGLSLANIEAAAADRTALDEVICDLSDALTGQAVTEANFTAALAGLAAGTGNRPTIVDILQGGQGAQVNYLWFVDLLGTAFVYATQGYSDCPCNPEWCWFEDFTASNGGWARVPGTAYGVYVAGTGWRGNKAGNVYAAYLYRQFSSRVLHRIYLTIYVPPGSLTSGANVIIFNGSSQVLLNTALIEGTHTYVWEGEVTSAEIRINPNDTTQNFTVTSIQLWGLGDNPFGTDNCP